jgi:hypothetical protein
MPQCGERDAWATPRKKRQSLIEFRQLPNPLAGFPAIVGELRFGFEDQTGHLLHARRHRLDDACIGVVSQLVIILPVTGMRDLADHTRTCKRPGVGAGACLADLEPLGHLGQRERTPLHNQQPDDATGNARPAICLGINPICSMKFSAADSVSCMFLDNAKINVQSILNELNEIETPFPCQADFLEGASYV